mmetsp:Transcript_23866/g.58512  ORF Transcript_23866/g.58512 Transcript_23866/m.58512 type:complete len:207 (+) Transcript_23866:858-1478(+)
MRAVVRCCRMVSGMVSTRMMRVVATMADHHSRLCATWKYSITYMSAAVVGHPSPAMFTTSPTNAGSAALNAWAMASAVALMLVVLALVLMLVLAALLAIPPPISANESDDDAADATALEADAAASPPIASSSLTPLTPSPTSLFTKPNHARPEANRTCPTPDAAAAAPMLLIIPNPPRLYPPPPTVPPLPRRPPPAARSRLCDAAA